MVIMKTMGQDTEAFLYCSIINKIITTLGGITTALDTEVTHIHNCLIQELVNKSLESSPIYISRIVVPLSNSGRTSTIEAKPKAKQNRGIKEPIFQYSYEIQYG